MLESGLVLSFPALELKSIALPGSVFAPEHLLASPISEPVQKALSLIGPRCAAGGGRVLCVARPEMFTHGVSHDWLLAKLGPIRDHLCVSDGTTVRIIPGLRNHVFFHAQGRRADVAALKRLERRAPELLGVPLSQVNSAFRFPGGKGGASPKPFAIPALADHFPTERAFLKFYMPPFGLDAAAATMTESRAPSLPDWWVETLHYAPLTETSLDDAAYMTRIARIIAQTYFDPDAAIVVRLPPAADETAPLAKRVQAVLEALNGAQALVPAAPAARVVFVDGDVPPARLYEVARWANLEAHDTFDFWRHTPEFYGAFREFRVVARHARHNPDAVGALFAQMCGRTPTLVWPERAIDGELS